MNDIFALVGVSLLLALLPVVLGLFTCFLKFQIALLFLRSGLGASGLPSGPVVMALSVSLTGLVMSPQIDSTITTFYKALEQSESQDVSLGKSVFGYSEELFAPWRDFMEQNVGPKELEFFRVHYHRQIETKRLTEETDTLVFGPQEKEIVPLGVLIPAFVVSELQAGFRIGFLLLLPFLVIDLIVANLLVGMGMYMVSPVMISLPLKVVLLLITEGWLELSRGLISSYS